MTVESKQYLKSNWMTLANLVLLLGIVVNLSSWKQKTDDDIQTLFKHKDDKLIHMPVHEQLDIFASQQQFKGLDNKIDKIDKKVDLLLKKALEK